MNQTHVDNESAANFSAAYEASQDVSTKAPFRTPVSIQRKRPRRNSSSIQRLGFFEVEDRKISSKNARASAFHEEFYGTSESPEDAIINLIDGDIDEEREAILLGYEEYIEDSDREYFVDGLTDQERELVLKYGEEHPESLHPMKATFTRPETLKKIKRRYHRRYGASGYWHPEKVACEARLELEYLQRTFRSKVTYVPVKPALEPLNDEEQFEDSIDLTEAYELSHEFKRRSMEDSYDDGMRNRYSYNQDRNLRSQCPTSIRHQSWSEQLPWCGIPFLKQTFFGYTDAELDEVLNSEEEADLRSELSQWAMDLEFEEINQEFDYRDEAYEQSQDEAKRLCNHRTSFIRDYNHRVRQDDEFFEAMCNYNLELALEDDLDRLDAESLMNDVMSFGRYREYAEAV